MMKKKTEESEIEMKWKREKNNWHTLDNKNTRSMKKDVVYKIERGISGSL